MLGEGRGFADGGFGVVWWGAFGGGWCWWYMCHWVGVGFVGWWLIGGGVGLVRVWHREITLSVQDLVCDGCRWVAVDEDSGRVLGGEWRGCGLVAGLRCGFVFCWDWLFVGLWFVGSVGGGGCTGLLVGVGGVDVWSVWVLLFRC